MAGLGRRFWGIDSDAGLKKNELNKSSYTHKTFKYIHPFRSVSKQKRLTIRFLGSHSQQGVIFLCPLKSSNLSRGELRSGSHYYWIFTLEIPHSFPCLDLFTYILCVYVSDAETHRRYTGWKWTTPSLLYLQSVKVNGSLSGKVQQPRTSTSQRLDI